MKINDYFGIRGLKYTLIDQILSTNSKIYTLYKVVDSTFDPKLKAGTYYCIVETNSAEEMRKIIPYLEEVEAQELMKDFKKEEK